MMANYLTFVPLGVLAVTDPVFQQAFEAVRKSYSDEAWNALAPRQITEAIYQEIRRIDAEKATSGTKPPSRPRKR